MENFDINAEAEKLASAIEKIANSAVSDFKKELLKEVKHAQKEFVPELKNCNSVKEAVLSYKGHAKAMIALMSATEK
jgi:predicted secreted protein